MKKILYINRPCSLSFLESSIRSRSKTITCAYDTHGWTQPDAFSLTKLPSLVHALQAGEFDLVIALSHSCPFWRNNVNLPRNLTRLTTSVLRNSSAFGLRLLIPAIKKHRVPLAIIDDDDSSGIAHRNWALLEAATLYFKMNVPIDLYHAFLYQDSRTGSPHNVRNIQVARDNLHKIKPCGIGFNTKLPSYSDVLVNQNKTHDIFFTGSMSYSQYRQETLAEFLALQSKGVKVDHFEGRLPFEDFLRRCASSHLTWSPHGAGWDSLRNYEASFAGSVAVCTYPNIRRYQPLQQNEHILMYSPEPGGLTSVVTQALRQKSTLPSMTAAARKFTLEHHHPDRIVDHIVSQTLLAACNGAVP